MRIVHTSDWHAGRRWHRLDRNEELRAVLEHLCAWVETNDVDLVLVSGDLFDGSAPSAAALDMVLSTLVRLGRSCPVVAIAGNHDSARRLDALAPVLALANVTLIGRPRAIADGGAPTIPTRRGDAVVAALPFAPTRMLVSALERQDDDTVAHQRYADGVRGLVAHLCGAFRDDAVNLLLAHTHLDGAEISNSERPVHIGEQWAAPPQALPSDAHYIALGHIHRPQEVAEAPSPARYAGSPLQLDFGEEGEAKSFVVVEAAPGLPATVTRVPYEGARRLATWEGTLEELEAQAEALRATGDHLRVRLLLEAPRSDLSARVREQVPNAVIIRARFPDTQESAEVTRPEAPRPLFETYWTQLGKHSSEALMTAFDDVYARASEEVA